MPSGNKKETICIISEAGRGALAGPLCFVGCISGQSDHRIVWHSPKEIDELGISACIRRSIEQIKSELCADRYIFGGYSPFGVETVETLVSVKTSIPDMTAAKALAKDSRARAMLTLDKEYPRYGFASNLGYDDAIHLDMIKRYGFCEIHRKSFVVKKIGRHEL